MWAHDGGSPQSMCMQNSELLEVATWVSVGTCLVRACRQSTPKKQKQNGLFAGPLGAREAYRTPFPVDVGTRVLQQLFLSGWAEPNPFYGVDGMSDATK